jgi:hypothetical protein
MRFVCKVITITVVILFVTLVGFYLWCFTSFRLYFNLLDAPTLEFETTWFDRSKNETYIFLKSDIPLEEFDGSSYLRLLGREATDSLPYSKYFKDDILIDNVVLDCNYIVRREATFGGFIYVAITPGELPSDTIYARLFFIKAYGYSFGSNLIRIKKEHLCSRKGVCYGRTQLSEISEKTAIGYLKELSEKYSPGSVIADVPSNRVGANAGIFEENEGNILKGQMILEVPVQKEPVPESVLRYAAKEKIKIRDTEGTIYRIKK